jgi:hypothetical protein
LILLERMEQQGFHAASGYKMVRAFSSEVDAGSREDPKGRVSEYATKQESRAPI